MMDISLNMLSFIFFIFCTTVSCIALVGVIPEVNTSVVQMVWSDQSNDIQDMASWLDSILIIYLPCSPASFWIMLKVTVAIGLILIIYRRLSAPINRIKLLGDVGYIPYNGLTMKEMSNVVRKQRVTGDIPPVYPNGWFSVLESRDLGKKESKAVSCLGEPVFMLEIQDTMFSRHSTNRALHVQAKPEEVLAFQPSGST